MHVLSAFARRPEPGVRVTLVTADLATPYSGMLPGVIAGLYAPEEAHIDLVRLAAATGARLIHAMACGIHRDAKRVLLEGRSALAYDLLSIDVGIAPALGTIPGAQDHAIAVKPIGSFLAKFAALLDRCRARDGPRRIAVIGGGAGGVELVLSLRSRLLADARAHRWDPGALSFALVTDGEILGAHQSKVRGAFRRLLAARGIALHEHRRACQIDGATIAFERGSTLAADAVLIATDGGAPLWFAATGLARDSAGFLAVRPTLQVANDPSVFAAGDCAALIETPRPKAGVFAVRAGPPLAANLRRAACGERLRSWSPQRLHLALISAGERYAVASRGAFKVEGAWVWAVKDFIDRRWMREYRVKGSLELR
jgi:selenide, water dikinase